MLTDPDKELPREKSGNRRPRNAHISRHRYPLDFKLKVLNETFEPGPSVAAIARRYDINTNVIFRGRKEFRDGKLDAYPEEAHLCA